MMSRIMLMCVCVFCANTFAEDLEFNNTWLRATPPGVSSAAIYGDLINNSDDEEVLVSVTSNVAKRVMLHRTSDERGMMRMMHVDKLILTPRAQESLSPGGLHLMLTGLQQSLTEGERVTVKLHFQSGLEIDASARVGSIAQLDFPEE